VVDISKRLRELMAAYDSASYVISGSFAEVDPELESLAQQLRPAVEDTAGLLYGFLDRLERTPAYIEARSVALQKQEHL
jgi:hypothetical protein